MARAKHKPLRTCIVCRQTKDKRQLIRVVRTPAGEVVVDLTGKTNGRGAYVCRQEACWGEGLKKERLSNALKVAVSTADMATLKASLQLELS